MGFLLGFWGLLAVFLGFQWEQQAKTCLQVRVSVLGFRVGVVDSVGFFGGFWGVWWVSSKQYSARFLNVFGKIEFVGIMGSLMIVCMCLSKGHKGNRKKERHDNPRHFATLSGMLQHL